VRSVLTIALFLTTIFTPVTEAFGQQRGARSGINVPREPILVSRRLLRDSGKIFSGTVLQVEHRNSDSSSALATTKIVFRVDEAIRNVRRGQTLEINEWAGLWQSGERYHPGERVLLFLYPPSRLGLTSPVGNRAGRFAVNRAGSVTVKTPIGKPPRTIEVRRVLASIRQAEQE
jgi:hypothetical protein